MAVELVFNGSMFESFGPDKAGPFALFQARNGRLHMQIKTADDELDVTVDCELAVADWRELAKAISEKKRYCARWCRDDYSVLIEAKDEIMRIDVDVFDVPQRPEIRIAAALCLPSLIKLGA